MFNVVVDGILGEELRLVCSIVGWCGEGRAVVVEVLVAVEEPGLADHEVGGDELCAAHEHGDPQQQDGLQLPQPEVTHLNSIIITISIITIRPHQHLQHQRYSQQQYQHNYHRYQHQHQHQHLHRPQKTNCYNYS